MRSFSQEIVSEILAGSSVAEVTQIVVKSAKLYEEKTNTRLVKDYLINMVKSLQALNELNHSAKEIENAKVAIKLFRELYRQKHHS